MQTVAVLHSAGKSAPPSTHCVRPTSYTNQLLHPNRTLATATLRLRSCDMHTQVAGWLVRLPSDSGPPNLLMVPLNHDRCVRVTCQMPPHRRLCYTVLYCTVLHLFVF